MGAKGVLLDTNVISELTRARPDPNVVSFVRSEIDPWLSTITLHELVYGAERSADPGRKTKLLAWITEMRVEFSGRFVVADNEVAEHSGRLRALAAAQGRSADPLDALIAACAQVYGLTLATRNVGDFEAFGISVLNPWDAGSA
jgi:predicted nucleic acid-binding protein